MSTGKHLAGTKAEGDKVWLTPDGHKVWCGYFPSVSKGWAIIKDNKSNATKLKPLQTPHNPAGFPWRPSDDCKIMDNRWILSSSGKWVLWLPHNWQLGKRYEVWSGQFLAFLDPELPEAVILELLKE
jgi:hypothetical protein